MALPIAIGLGGQGLLFVIDTVMAGRLGVVSLAAAAFSGNLLAPIYVFGLGLAVAVPVLTAQGRGAGRPEHGAAALLHGLLITGVFGTLMGLAVHVGVHFGMLEVLAHGLGMKTSQEVITEAEGFAILLGWSFLPGLLFQCLKNHREAVGQPWVSLQWLVVGIVVNAVANWVFMFGNLGVPAMGLAGAGLGTLLGRTAMLIGLARYSDWRLVRWRNGIRWRWVRASLALGIPSAAQWTFESGIFAIAPLLIGRFGNEQLAAHQVANSLVSFAFMIPLGISQGASIRVGEAFGARDKGAMRRIAAGALLFAGLFMGLYSVFVAVFRHWIPLLFLTEPLSPTTLAFAADFILVAAAFGLCDGLQVVASGALRGMSDVKFTSVAAFVSYWLVCLPVGWMLGNWCGLEGLGIWIGLAVGLFVATVALNLRLWQKLRGHTTSVPLPSVPSGGDSGTHEG
ncbi:MAG: MATE family efflux transporter [Puniceicoccales bacterium]|nr:MATE family efflux transporter [Puniceicoccales bacterium]